MEESRDPARNNHPNSFLVQEYGGASSRTATTPKRGLVQEVCREWLVHEDGALAHQLQDQEIAAHYGHNRERNRLVRQDTPHARLEQEDELKKALAVQAMQQKLRLQQEREDAEAAMRLAEELEREELLKRQVRAIRDEQLAKRLQDTAAVPKIVKKDQFNEAQANPGTETISKSMRLLELNQPMSEDEARQWQELCDAEMARKLQLEEEEESKFRRDITDLSRKLAIEAQDRELAQQLYEKEKARLRKAKEKARLKRASAKQTETSPVPSMDRHSNDGGAGGSGSLGYPTPSENIAASIDPTWNRRQHYPYPSHQQAPIPVTDLDMPAPIQPIVPGHRRGLNQLAHSPPISPEPSNKSEISTSSRSKIKGSCSPQ